MKILLDIQKSITRVGGEGILFKILSDEKGSFMVEAVLSFILFLVIFLGIIEVLSLVESKLYVEKISREVCHEASITTLDDANVIKDNFKLQYFNKHERPYVYIEDLNANSTNETIYCYVVYYHPPFKHIYTSNNEGRRKPIEARTVFPRHESHI